MLKSILLSILVCFALGLYAQDSTRTLHTIKPNHIYIGGGYICNDSIYTICDVKNKLINNPAAYKEYNRYTSIKASSNLFGVLWFAGFVGGIVTLNSSNNLSGKLFLASFVPLYVSIHISSRAQKHFSNAINICNSQY